eukprot:TRINITY_DN8644_c0_g1_i2.p1 TRINITY_DN8644_c0_g1~~TRINITY_DN8644_c0_g1_i2.p1  ORF type:complete len:116 (-),score=49.51 TRINITY_DN8644_c0_g1_i2:67-414(-)
MSTGTISGIRRIMMNQLKKLLKAVENQDPNNTAVEEQEMDVEDSQAEGAEEFKENSEEEVEEADVEEEGVEEEDSEESEDEDVGETDAAFSQIDFLENLMKSIDKETQEEEFEIF